jgi:uncharacterized repeat protein (TIGR01451 family)
MLSLYKNIIGCLLAMLFFTDSVFGQFTEPNIIHFDEEILRNPDSIPPGTSFIDRWGYPWNNPFARSAQVVFAAPHTCGRFSLTFADEGVTGKGFDDPSIVNLPAGHPLGVSLISLGALRRWTACEVFKYISNTISIPASVNPDILFDESETDGTGGLAYATPFFRASDYTTPGFYGGLLNEHILTGIDPTPVSGDFDAKIVCDFGINNTWPSQNGNISFNSDANNTEGTGIDVYSIILHEATHALGFFSNINVNGSSLLTNNTPPNQVQGAYSLFDRYIVDASSSGFYAINNFFFASTNASGLQMPGAYDYFKQTNTKRYTIYTPTMWRLGTSISHFDDQIDGINYVMSPYTAGQPNRKYTKAELEALCNLGYSLLVNDFDCADRYAIGVNDNITGTSLSTPISVNVITNDYDPDGQAIELDITSVQLLSNAGTLSVNGNTITLTPNGTFCGNVIIKYRPKTTINGYTGSYATLTITIPCPGFCPSDPCNLICNGSFEEGLTLQQFDDIMRNSYTNGARDGVIRPWDNLEPQNFGADGYFSGSQVMLSPTIPARGIPLNIISRIMPGVETPESSNRYAGMGSSQMPSPSQPPYSEGLYVKLIQPLIVNTEYRLSYKARAVSLCNNRLPSPPPSGDAIMTTSFSNVVPLKSTFGSGSDLRSFPIQTVNSNSVANTWTNISFPFFATSNSSYLAFAPQITSYPNDPNGAEGMCNGVYVYLDDVRLERIGEPQISTTVTSSITNPLIGQNVTFIINVCNVGSNPATNVGLTNVLPAGFNFISSNFSPSYPNHTFNNIPAGGCVSIAVTAEVQPDVATNIDLNDCATITSLNSCVQIQACNSVRILATNISVAATQENCNQFKVVIANTGSIVAHNLALNYTPPTCLGYSSYTAIPENSATFINGVITVPIITPGSSVIVTMTGSSSSVPTGCVNTVQLASLDEYDINLSDNGESITFEPCGEGGGERCIYLPKIQ